MSEPDWFDDDGLDEMDDDEAFLDFVCGLRADGTCALAGTEDCDWECPHSRD